MLTELFGGKPWFKSITAWGLLLLGVAQVYGESYMPGSELVAQYLPTIGAILAGLGIRKAATTPNAKVETVVTAAE